MVGRSGNELFRLGRVGQMLLHIGNDRFQLRDEPLGQFPHLCEAHEGVRRGFRRAGQILQTEPRLRPLHAGCTPHPGDARDPSRFPFSGGTM